MGLLPQRRPNSKGRLYYQKATPLQIFFIRGFDPIFCLRVWDSINHLKTIGKLYVPIVYKGMSVKEIAKQRLSFAPFPPSPLSLFSVGRYGHDRHALRAACRSPQGRNNKQHVDNWCRLQISGIGRSNQRRGGGEKKVQCNIYMSKLLMVLFF